MSATIEATKTRDPQDLASAVSLLLDNDEIRPLDTVWRLPDRTYFVGMLPPALDPNAEPIGTAERWSSLADRPASRHQKGTAR